MLAENGAACEEPLLSKFTQIFCYPPKKFIRIVHEKTEKCDRICEKVMEVIKCNFNLEITPIARTLFGLRCKRNKLWVPDSHTLQHEELYEFRLRFKVIVIFIRRIWKLNFTLSSDTPNVGIEESECRCLWVLLLSIIIWFTEWGFEWYWLQRKTQHHFGVMCHWYVIYVLFDLWLCSN